MKVGSIVQINVNSFCGDVGHDNPVGVVGEVVYHDPSIWTEVKWPSGVVSAYDMEDLICLDKDGYVGKPKLPTVIQPEGGFDPEFVSRVINKINDYHTDYLECHPHDWDCCGFASVTVEFGRKKKMKDLVLGLGFDVAYKSGTDSYLNPKFRIPYCGHQSLTYKENMMKIVCDEINNVVGEKVAYVRSYVD